MCRDIALFSKTDKIGSVFDFLSQARRRGSRYQRSRENNRILESVVPLHNTRLGVRSRRVLRLFLYGREAISGARAVTAEGDLLITSRLSSFPQNNCDFHAIIIEL